MRMNYVVLAWMEQTGKKHVSTKRKRERERLYVSAWRKLLVVRRYSWGIGDTYHPLGSDAKPIMHPSIFLRVHTWHQHSRRPKHMFHIWFPVAPASTLKSRWCLPFTLWHHSPFMCLYSKSGWMNSITAVNNLMLSAWPIWDLYSNASRRIDWYKNGLTQRRTAFTCLWGGKGLNTSFRRQPWAENMS